MLIFGLSSKSFCKVIRSFARIPCSEMLYEWVDYPVKNLQLKCILKSNFYVFMQFLNMLDVRLSANIKNAFVSAIKLVQTGRLEEFASF